MMTTRIAIRALARSCVGFTPGTAPIYRAQLPRIASASFHSTSRRFRNAYTSDSPQLPPPPSEGSGPSTNLEVGGEKQKVGQVEPRLSLTFTCTAPLPPSSTASSSTSSPPSYDGGTATTASAAASPSASASADAGQEAPERTCGHRSTHEFSKRSYENGIVLIQCPSCKSRHLIADHLGWFKESTEEGRYKNVEDLLRAKGEKVTRGRVNFDGDVEYDGSA